MNKKTVINFWHSSGMFIVFILLFAAVSLFVPDFLTTRNLQSLALQVTTIGVVACSMMLCLAAGDFDLSIGSIVALSGVVLAVLLKTGTALPVAVLAALGSGIAVGAVNGFFIAKVGVNALITTLASMQIVRGAALIIAGGTAVGIQHEGFMKFGMKSFFGTHISIWIMGACFVVFGVILNKTIFGRNALAIGGNSEAAGLAGISVPKHKIIIFAIQGLMAAIAGVVLAARFFNGIPKNGEGLELDVISACVLGGVSLTGGVASISGVVMGVFIMGIVQNSMSLMNVDPFWQKVATGGILLIAVTLDRIKHRKSK
jgi:L-arabinose transport system permease protein